LIFGDHLGYASLTTGITATVVSELRYTSFGEVRWQNGASASDHQFTGARYDATSNIVQMGARWYSPLLGRFLSADSIVPRHVDPQSLNRYAYTRNSPITHVDPNGHADCAADISFPCTGEPMITKALTVNNLIILRRGMRLDCVIPFR